MCGITLLLEHAAAASIAQRSLLANAPLAQEIEKKLRQRGPDHFGSVDCSVSPANGVLPWSLRLCSAVLHLRGDALTPQPMEDARGNVLCWNGEVFGYDNDRVIPGNDTQWLSDLLHHTSESCEDPTDQIVSVLQRIQGPFAFVWFHEATQRLFFGHDRFGRRSLLFHTGSEELQNKVLSLSPETRSLDISGLQRLVLSSVVLPVDGEFSHFDELLCTGVYVLDLATQQLIFHAYEPLVSSQSSIIPIVRDAYACGLPASVSPPESPLEAAAEGLLIALSNAVGVRVRTIPKRPSLDGHASRVGVLFSGGLDSVVLAALTHFHVEDPDEPIDLLNVCFDSASQFQSPDRLAAKISHRELMTLFPTRKWRFIHVNVVYDRVLEHQTPILELLAPCDTQMDFNIGAAFWFLSRGQGHVVDSAGGSHGDVGDLNGFLSKARISTKQLNGEAAIQALRLFPSNAEDKSSFCPAAKCKRKLKPGCALGVCKVCCLKAQKLLVKLNPAGDKGAVVNEKEVMASRNQLAAMLGDAGDEHAVVSLLQVYETHWKASNGEICRVHRDKKKTPDHQVDAVTSESSAPSPEAQETTAATTTARVLLVGIGADEQLGGYGRHKTAFLKAGSDGLRSELARDMQRIWKRNLGRDDRCISAHGREARFPFLDERVVQYIASLPLDCVCDFDKERGEGDKLVLRLAAKRLGLANCATLAKRAIQFGTRIAKHANAVAFGSNRQASGDAKIRLRAAPDDDKDQ